MSDIVEESGELTALPEAHTELLSDDLSEPLTSTALTGEGAMSTLIEEAHIELLSDDLSEPLTSTALTEEGAISALIEEAHVFTKFPGLPIELQLQVWEAALPKEGRLVALWLKTWHMEDGSPKEAPENFHKFLCKNAPPTLLHVTRQSRQVASKLFSLQIKTPIQKCPIYINPYLDTIYTYNFYASADERFKNIRYLAIPFTDTLNFPPGCADGVLGGEVGDLVGRLRRNLPYLLDVVFVKHHGRCLLHAEGQFGSIEFSHLTDSAHARFARAWDLEVTLEKGFHPEWNPPRFIGKVLEMPDGKLTCEEVVV